MTIAERTITFVIISEPMAKHRAVDNKSSFFIARIKLIIGPLLRADNIRTKIK